MEISEEGPDFGLVSTRMVSVLKPVTSPASPTVPSRSSEPRISQLSPAVSALFVNQDCLLSCPSTQFHAENIDSPKARITARKNARMTRPICRFLWGARLSQWIGILLCYCRTKVVWACSVALFVACQWVWRRILVPAETHGDCSELKQEQTMQETMMPTYVVCWWSLRQDGNSVERWNRMELRMMVALYACWRAGT